MLNEDSKLYAFGGTLGKAFTDPTGEASFRSHYIQYVRIKSRIIFFLQAVFHAVAIVIEESLDFGSGGFPVLVVCRGAIVFICLCGGCMTIDQDLFQKWADYGLSLSYLLIGCILIIMYGLCSMYQADDHSISPPPYLFHLGLWSLPSSLIYAFVVFGLSGLRFNAASYIGFIHGVLFISVIFLGFSNEYEKLFAPSILYYPLFFCMCIVTCKDSEDRIRHHFLLKCQLGDDLRRQDKLIHSILPEEISLAIKSNQIESLAQSYDDVTIMFCYIVDFGRQSSSTYAQDLVALLIRIITMFDRIVDLTGVYKVANVAEMYMCCGGCPQMCPDHAVRVAKMALAMMEAVQACGWRWSDGTPVVLQIGIHTGPVVAGVVGSKTYNYTIFGDSVNTASRMCSHSIPGRIQLSEGAYRAIVDQCSSNEFVMESRGNVEVKGKGTMHTYWLLNYANHEVSLREKLFAKFNASRTQYNGLQRFTQESSRNKSKYSIRLLDLAFQERKEEAEVTGKAAEVLGLRKHSNVSSTNFRLRQLSSLPSVDPSAVSLVDRLKSIRMRPLLDRATSGAEVIERSFFARGGSVGATGQVGGLIGVGVSPPLRRDATTSLTQERSDSPDRVAALNRAMTERRQLLRNDSLKNRSSNVTADHGRSTNVIEEEEEVKVEDHASTSSSNPRGSAPPHAMKGNNQSVNILLEAARLRVIPQNRRAVRSRNTRISPASVVSDDGGPRPRKTSYNSDRSDEGLAVEKLEEHYTVAYNRMNVNQFRRMMILFVASLLIWMQEYVQDPTYLLGYAAAVVGLFAMLGASYVVNYKRYLQQITFFVCLCIYGIYAINAKELANGSREDERESANCGLIAIVVVIFNYSLRLRFRYSGPLSALLLVTYITSTSSTLRQSKYFFGNLFYLVFIWFITVEYNYFRELGLSSDFLYIYSLEHEKIKSHKMLSNMLPSTSHAQQLIKGELILDELKDITLLYSDMKGFTQLSSNMPASQLCTLLNVMYTSFDKHLDHFGLYKIDIIGDAFVVAGGLPGYKSVNNHALACVQFALHMQRDMEMIRSLCLVDVQLRIGIHTGTVMGSVISLNKPRYLVWGPSTLTANVMESQGVPGGVNISWETKCRLDPAELESLNIRLVDREHIPKIAIHTRSAHLVECSDMSAFLHETWNENECTEPTHKHFGSLTSGLSTNHSEGREIAPSEQSFSSTSWNFIFGKRSYDKLPQQPPAVDMGSVGGEDSPLPSEVSPKPQSWLKRRLFSVGSVRTDNLVKPNTNLHRRTSSLQSPGKGCSTSPRNIRFNLKEDGTPEDGDTSPPAIKKTLPVELMDEKSMSGKETASLPPVPHNTVKTLENAPAFGTFVEHQKDEEDEEKSEIVDLALSCDSESQDGGEKVTYDTGLPVGEVDDFRETQVTEDEGLLEDPHRAVSVISPLGCASVSVTLTDAVMTDFADRADDKETNSLLHNLEDTARNT